MLEVNREYNDENVCYDDICKMGREEEALVNTDRLYWLLSEESRTKQRQNIIRELAVLLDHISNDKRMYIPLNSEKIRELFYGYEKELPDNTFRRSNK